MQGRRDGLRLIEKARNEMELAETYRIAMRIAEEIKPEVDAVVSKMVDLME
ncbi:hypothetical protein LCGC14_2111170, partial [marine sediment metagenome]